MFKMFDSRNVKRRNSQPVMGSGATSSRSLSLTGLDPLMEIPEKSSGSKMLKKARSFRDDIKTKIKRRPSTGAEKMIPESVKAQTAKHKKNMHRNSSIPDGSKDMFDGVHHDDIDKLQSELDEINRTLKFIQAVANQDKPKMLPPTATHVLETVLDVFTVLNNILATEESTALVSGRSKVCQCLARFVRWSDNILVKTDKESNKQNASEVITALSDGIKDLTHLCIEKLERRKNSLPVKSSGSLSPGGNESLQRASLPEIPLTPRERQILAKTSDNGLYENTSIAHSHDSLENQAIFSFDTEDSPPPKPPLPQNVDGLITRLSRNGMDDEPPPLPEKEKRQSMSSLSTPTHSPRGSLLCSPSTEHSFNSAMVLSPSPRSSSPMGYSPASSVSSGLNQSTEELHITGNRSFSKSSTMHVSQTSNMSSNVMMSSSKSSSTVADINKLTLKINKLTTNIDSVPPPIPNKTRINRLLSTYDNVPFDGTAIQVCTSVSSVSSSRTIVNRISTSSCGSTQSSHSTQSASQSVQSHVQTQQKSSSSASFSTDRTSSTETYSSSETFSSATSHSSLESLQKGGQPPPLPPKLKHVHAYMQMVGSYTQPSALETISRHSINFYESQWHQHQLELFQYPRSNTISVISDISNFSSDTSFSSGSPDRFLGLPALPIKTKKYLNRQSQGSIVSSLSDTSANDLRDKTTSLVEASATDPAVHVTDIDLKRASAPADMNVQSILPEPLEESKSDSDIQKDTDSAFGEPKPLDDIDVSDQLIRKKEGEDGPAIRGGMVDALVVHATAAGKSGSVGDLHVNEEEFIYQEAFLTTYRTFITPKELIEKLLYRFYKFQHAADNKVRLAKNAFSLLIRVIDELGVMELDDEIIKRLMDLVYELLCQNDLVLARILRRKALEKCEHRDTIQEAVHFGGPISQNVTLSSTPVVDLLSFKSHDIAEQMTLMDAELFQKIEIPEVLLWAKEQSEELSPNLTFFTEHFNNMSYWCRTRILEQNDPKEREKYLMKFIKIMRHLRKLSNFNSYLAVLSALDSAPVRRLEWQKQNLEALKEFCLLIDSSSSFRAYRLALSETEPPCIPYLGLILQDLTFINIGNQNLLPDGSINFAKRWQLFNILDSMRRFKKCNYDIKRKDAILNYLSNFKDHDNEETLWQRSEKIKPRGVRKRVEVDL
ncbi:rap guanine nucleotide exchange factor 1 isoform X2 [Patella vulgata]|uniref:rap guanine nucleotide exchange factor 1 isoform X2 n=1 Tax=Patella vulgata TaxID=6465 RepID=UPI0024A970E7|nr:rap guanine nucleotide exchange factor 1 isoform X2 [Patella vulgata]